MKSCKIWLLKLTSKEVLIVSFLITSPNLFAQSGNNLPQEIISWADTILVNGQIVSMDDDGVNTHFGTTAQAMAVRDQKVLALGSNVQIEAMAGPHTDRIDLRGKTVIPGLIDTHSHLFQYADHSSRPIPEGLEPVPTGWEELPGKYETWNEVFPAIFAEVRKRAASQEKGSRIFLQITERGYLWDGEYVTSDPFVRYTLGLSLGEDEVISESDLRAKPISRVKLDEITTDHLVHIRMRNDGIGNSKLIDYTNSINYGPVMDPGVIETEQTGLTSNSFNRVMRGEVFDPFMNQVKWYKQENLLTAAMGVTTWSSNIRSLTQMAVYGYLDAIGEMSNRFGYGPSAGTPPQVHPSVLAEMGTGFNPTEIRFGSEYLWYVGTGAKAIDSAYPHFTTTLEPPQIPQSVKDREFSIDNNREMLGIVDYYVSRGNRFTNTHIAGDAALDMVFETLEEASRRNAMSLEQIRAKRHVIDHCTMNPRPDQIDTLRHFNMIASCSPKYIQNTSATIAEEYGEQYLNWIVPMRSLIDGGVTAVLEVDETIVRGMFWYLDLMVNREDLNGRVWAPEQRIDRVEALKAATIWATEYVGRKRDLGSLEPGKLADYLILNKDYFNVPSRMIKTVRPLMTVVGGNTVYLDPDYADELGKSAIGMQPIFALEHIAIWEAEAAAAVE